jgi:RNA polymerase sigma factor (sigma-70 family)
VNASVRRVPPSFEEVLRQYGPALGRLAGSYVRDLPDREDLLQEIALAIWQALPKFRGESSERTFVFRIAHNRALGYLARRRTVGTEPDEHIEDGGLDPERALSAQQEGERLLGAIQRLPIGSAQVVTLSLEGLTYADIGDVLGISESNVGARLTRARDMLRRLLRETTHDRR